MHSSPWQATGDSAKLSLKPICFNFPHKGRYKWHPPFISEFCQLLIPLSGIESTRFSSELVLDSDINSSVTFAWRFGLADASVVVKALPPFLFVYWRIRVRNIQNSI